MCSDLICLTPCLFSFFTHLFAPSTSYSRTGWPGINHQVTSSYSRTGWPGINHQVTSSSTLDCPDVTPCGWCDFETRELTNRLLLLLSSFLFCYFRRQIEHHNNKIFSRGLGSQAWRWCSTSTVVLFRITSPCSHAGPPWNIAAS